MVPVAAMLKGTGVEPPQLRKLAGWVTTYGTLGPDGGVVPTRDREGHIFEAARQLGLIDFSKYLTKGVGVWNYAHSPLRVGLPETLEFHDGNTDLSRTHRKVGFWGTGHLFDQALPESWKGVQEPSREEFAKADHCWDLATNLCKGPRTLGFSVEGTMQLSPCRSRILRASVSKAAVLEYPHNPDATAEAMIKGLSFDFLRRGMVGRRECGACSCPEGGCALEWRGSAPEPGPRRSRSEVEAEVRQHPMFPALARRVASLTGASVEQSGRRVIADVTKRMEF